MESITGMSFGLLIAIVAFFFVFSYLIPIRLWLAAMFSGAYVGLLTLIGMRFRRIPPKLIVEPRIAAISAQSVCGQRFVPSSVSTTPTASCAPPEPRRFRKRCQRC